MTSAISFVRDDHLAVMSAVMSNDSQPSDSRSPGLPAILLVFLLSLIPASGAACRRSSGSPEKPAAPNNSSNANSGNATPLIKENSVEAAPAFRTVVLTGAKNLEQLKSQLGPEGTTLMLKINRVDLKHIRTNETLLIPDAAKGLLSCSPFPLTAQSAGGMAKLIVVSRAIQAFGAYESGKLVMWGPTSTGKKATPTPEGLFFANWKARQTASTVDSAWILNWCVNLDNMDGVSLHEYELPGYPASHSCVRLLEADAHWIYGWIDQWILSKDGKNVLAKGTPVIIFDQYSYKDPSPWKRIGENRAAAVVSSNGIESAISKHAGRIQEALAARGSVMVQSPSPQSASKP